MGEAYRFGFGQAWFHGRVPGWIGWRCCLPVVPGREKQRYCLGQFWGKVVKVICLGNCCLTGCPSRNKLPYYEYGTIKAPWAIWKFWNSVYIYLYQQEHNISGMVPSEWNSVHILFPQFALYFHILAPRAVFILLSYLCFSQKTQYLKTTKEKKLWWVTSLNFSFQNLLL